ncbi:MAG: alpha/beta hydrolase [Ktedonobacterales bacterium]
MTAPTSRDDLSLVHLARAPRQAPATGERPPLLALLHGVGSNEHDLFQLAPALDPRFQVVSLRAPLVRGPDSFAWFNVEFLPEGYRIAPEQLAASRDRIAAFLDEAVTAYGADPARVYLLGFSQGAIMTLTLAQTQPRRLAGGVAIAGRIPTEVEPWIVAPDETAGLPLLQEHGRADQVIPIAWAQRARPVLERQRMALDYREYPAPHTISPAMLDDASAWLTARLDAPARPA